MGVGQEKEKTMKRLLLALVLLFSSNVGFAAAPAPDNQDHSVPHGYLLHEIDQDSVISVGMSLSKAIDQHSPRYVLRIDSEGGLVDSARDITTLFDVARENGVRIQCVVDGKAYSAAAYILQSCDDRLMTKRSIVMFHGPAFRGTGVSTDKTERDNLAGALQATEIAVAEQCASRLKVSFEEYMSHVSNGREWWLSWKAAYDVGAVDAIINNSRDLYKK